jgi:hypothetical protein
MSTTLQKLAANAERLRRLRLRREIAAANAPELQRWRPSRYGKTPEQIAQITERLQWNERVEQEKRDRKLQRELDGQFPERVLLCKV